MVHAQVHNLTLELSGEDIDVFNVHLIDSSILWQKVLDREDQFLAYLLQLMLHLHVLTERDHNAILYN